MSEEETDGMKEYFKEYCTQNQLKELSSQPEKLTVTPNSEAQPGNGQETVAKGLQQLTVLSLSLCCHQLRSL